MYVVILNFEAPRTRGAETTGTTAAYEDLRHRQERVIGICCIGMHLAETDSDPDGNFALPEVPPGTYKLTATAASLEELQKSLKAGDKQTLVAPSLFTPNFGCRSLAATSARNWNSMGSSTPPRHAFPNRVNSRRWTN